MTWRAHGQRMTVGSLRELIRYVSFTTTNVKGAPSRAESTVIDNLPAEKQIVGGGERIRGKQIEAGVDAVFTHRFVSGITPQMKIVHVQTGDVYNITVPPQPVDDRNQFYIVQCKRVANNG